MARMNGMTKEQEEHFLPLKNGATANVRLALLESLDLARLLDTDPDHFAVLHQIASASSPEDAKATTTSAPKQSIRFLRITGYLRKADATMDPLTRNVLLSSFQQTPDGPTVVQPFVLSGPDDRQMVDMAQSKIDKSIRKWLRRLGGDGDTPGPSSGRT